jgi:serine/threonine protein kinase
MSGDAQSSESIFGEAIGIESPEERAAYLDAACEGNPELRREMEKLVADHFRAGDFLEWPAADLAATRDQPPIEAPGVQIGPYKLLQQIGEGGMGVVYMAEQSEPVERRVALKIIKPGMDSPNGPTAAQLRSKAIVLPDFFLFRKCRNHRHLGKDLKKWAE